MSLYTSHRTTPYDWQDHDEQYDPSRWDAPHRERRRDEDPYASDDDDVTDPEMEDDCESDTDHDNDSLARSIMMIDRVKQR